HAVTDADAERIRHEHRDIDPDRDQHPNRSTYFDYHARRTNPNSDIDGDAAANVNPYGMSTGAAQEGRLLAIGRMPESWRPSAPLIAHPSECPRLLAFPDC